MINLGNETDLIEFKRNLDRLDESLISIASMLNKSGKGNLYFRVKDNGDAIGLEVTKSTLREILKEIQENIKPIIYPGISLVERTSNVIKVFFAGLDRPYSFKNQYYIRESNKDRKLNLNELMELIQKTDSSNAAWEKLKLMKLLTILMNTY